MDSTLPTVAKNPLRLPRYVVLLFLTEFVQGSPAQRQRFISRITRRVAQRFGLYALAYRLFKVWHKITALLKSRDDLLAQEKYPQFSWAISGLKSRDCLWSWVKQRYADGPKIIVLGMGSVGDILQITPVLRSLREKFPDADICLLHRSPAVKMVLRGNKNIDAIALADFHHFEQIKKAVSEEGAADIVVEIQSVSYILTYTCAPAALRHPALTAAMPDAFFAKAAAALELWQRHPPVFPRREEKFSWPEEWKDFQYLDVLGATGNLPIDRNSALDFFTDAADEGALHLVPGNKRFITVQHGVDTDVMNWSRATGQRATKLLPMATWKDTVRLLRGKGLSVIQLGTKEDALIDGVDVDLRGETTLRQAAVFLKNAVCHVGTEGGLVHLARAMNTRSVVTFGPTSVTFLGYPQNTNLVASDCTSCWWTTKDWFIYCPRGLTEPECMNAHKAEVIVEAVMKIAGI